MKQIKTIKNRLDNNEEFDNEVNTAIKEGWTLVKRDIILPIAQSPLTTFYTMLYAELERDVYNEGDKKYCKNCKHDGTLFVPGSPCPKCKKFDKWEAKA